MNGLRPIVEYDMELCGVGLIKSSTTPKMLQMSGGQFPVPIVFRVSMARRPLAATHSRATKVSTSHWIESGHPLHAL